MLDRRIIGKQFPPVVNEIERGTIRRFALAVGDMNPTHHDPAAALAAGYPNLVAPPTFAASLESGLDLVSELQIDPRNVTLVEQSFEYHLPICAGDTLSVTSRVVELYEKQVPGGAWDYVVVEDEGRDARGSLVYKIRKTLGIRPASKVEPVTTVKAG